MPCGAGWVWPLADHHHPDIVDSNGDRRNPAAHQVPHHLHCHQESHLPPFQLLHHPCSRLLPLQHPWVRRRPELRVLWLPSEPALPQPCQPQRISPPWQPWLLWLLQARNQRNLWVLPSGDFGLLHYFLMITCLWPDYDNWGWVLWAWIQLCLRPHDHGIHPFHWVWHGLRQVKGGMWDDLEKNKSSCLDNSGLGPFVLIFFHAWHRPRQPWLWPPLRRDRTEARSSHCHPYSQVVKKLFIGLWNPTLQFFVFSIPSVVASQMPGYITYSLMKTLIGAGSGGWSVNVASRN